jgi:hypothetical protein
MRCGIVKASALAKARRWDVEYFLGNSAIMAGERVAQVQTQLAEVQVRLDKAEGERAKTIARVTALEASGAVRVIQ